MLRCYLEKSRAKQWRTRHRRQPAQRERIQNDTEQGAAIFTGGILRGADSGERHNGNNCSTQHRQCRLSDDVFGCIKTGFALAPSAYAYRQ